MSGTLHVITNSMGSGDYVIVYETNCGEVVFEGHSVKPRDLFNIIESTNGMCEYLAFHEFTDEQMENWEEEIYN
jgi:hypothetical protein